MALIPGRDARINLGAEWYECGDFVTLRERLNETKSKMDKFYVGSKTNQDLARRWWRLQTVVDIYRPLRKHISETYGAQFVTNAWLKYYELYSIHNIVPLGAKKFKAFFNAELPGAALCAFNHYMATMRPDCDFDWRASSLSPEVGNTAVLGDSYGLYAANTDRWLMEVGDSAHRNDDNTSGTRRNNGDATNIENIRDWAAKLAPGVDFYSHDAGIDVSEGEGGELNFNRQEEANARLHLGCALAGFMCLKKGGAFIAKQYTFFETLTWNLILIYSTLFDKFYVCKPLTSRPYNSEVYLVGLGYRGISDELRDALEKKLTAPADEFMRPIVPRDALDSAVLADVIRAARTIFGQQVQFIEENLALFNVWGNRLEKLNKEIEPLRRERHEAWLKMCPLRPIDRSRWLANTVS